ncbi:hypothetical protein [Bacillus piscicola]|uniref:hypothetical protein n=1 Tax=Bacillus piscicola TaxID=1632684 RepID=UPI001F092810|nr:hypothetical protein [Bacillus piscicola]
MNKWTAAFFTMLAALFIPANAYAAEMTWSDAEPMFITVLTIISVVALVYFIYSMIRNV